MDPDVRQLTYIDLEDRGSRRSGVVAAVVVVLLVALLLAPPIMRDLSAPAEAPRTGMAPASAAAPARCHPAVDVPQMLDPLARIVLPGWTRLCGWIVEADLAEPIDPGS